jgi:transcriptional regulator
LVVFAGPHAYVSPSWYESQPSVPTWNYAAVHAYGVPRLVDDPRLKQIVDRLVAKYEAQQSKPWPNDLPAAYRAKLLEGVVGFEIPIDHLEGKFKLGQNRSAEDQQSMLAQLKQGNKEAQALAAFILQQ